MPIVIFIFVRSNKKIILTLVKNSVLGITMMKSKNQKGFTLVEMIGVLAVIGILASVATPRIIETIEDAKISKYLLNTKTLSVAVAKYYVDTGTYPALDSNYPISTHPHTHQLVTNAINAAGDPITGWQGPYLEKEPKHPSSNTARIRLATTSDARYACDVDGDGTSDGTFFMLIMDTVGDTVGEKISNSIDSDAGSTTWKSNGLIKQYNSNSTTLVHCLSRV